MRLTNNEFLEKAFKIHPNKFNYLSEYITAKIKINIECKNCNFIFKQTPSNHIFNKRGCPKCSTKSGAIKQSKTNKQFLKQCKEIHADKFIYLSEYINNRSMIKIQCKFCNNVFEQLATNHIDKKCGCPKCNRFVGFSINNFISKNPKIKNKPAKLYFYKFWNKNEEFYKVGITTTIRDFGVSDTYNIKLISEVNTTLYDAILKEQKFLDDFKNYRYKPFKKFKGWTECFRKEIYDVMFI
jgi:hypothetical protein